MVIWLIKCDHYIKCNHYGLFNDLKSHGMFYQEPGSWRLQGQRGSVQFPLRCRHSPTDWDHWLQAGTGSTGLPPWLSPRTTRIHTVLYIVYVQTEFLFQSRCLWWQAWKKKVGAAQRGTNNIAFTLLMMYDRMPLTQKGGALFRQDSNKPDPWTCSTEVIPLGVIYLDFSSAL